MSSWTLTYAGTTQSFASWGLSNVTRSLKSFATDTVTFRAPGRAIDATPIFPIWANITIRNPAGVTCFVGLITKIPVRGSGNAEDQSYEVSGPWWNFEKLVFQQEWMIDPLGDGTLVPTLRTTTIIGQQNDGTRLDLGEMALIVINYVLAAIPSSTRSVPFQMGMLSPDTIIPFSEVKDMTCAQLLKTFFAYIPDAIAWFDYSTAPHPTLNILQRGGANAVSLPIFGGPVDSVSLTPREDLVVPAVVIKYEQTNTIDGETYSEIIPDIYPADAPDPAIGNMVTDVELLPGNATYEKQKLTTTDRPKDYDSIAGTGTLSTVTWPWLTGEHRANWLKSYTIPVGWPVGKAPWPAGNATLNDVVVNIPESDFVVRRVKTNLTSNYVPTPPATGLVLPGGTVPPGGGPDSGGTGVNLLDQLGAELLTGTVTDWMTDNQNVYRAQVKISIIIQYTGSDPYVASWFSPGPTCLLALDFSVAITNGSSQEYSQLASETPSEPVPVGLAQNIYQGLSVLHYEGEIGLTEQECSQIVGLGNVLNLTGAIGPGAAWATMNAQVFEISEDIDKGKTRIRVGPPVHLDAAQLTEILRATRGRIQSWHLDQQKTGKADTDNSVSGAGDTARSGVHTPPGGSAPAALHKFSVVDASLGATPQLILTPGWIIDTFNGYANVVPKIGGVAINNPSAPKLTVATSNTIVYFDITVDATTAHITSIDVLAADSLPASTSTHCYLPITTIVVTITAGIAKVQSNDDGLGGSQFRIWCGPAPVPTDFLVGNQFNFAGA